MESRRDTSSAGRAIEPDVLIIGGGVQGLWLLNELHGLKYLALLVERRELGGEQTCHSHVYIHEGHLYRAAHGRLSQKLRGLRSVWDVWLKSHHVERGYGPSCFGFQDPTEAAAKLALWSHLGLPTGEPTTRDVLNGGPISRLYETGEQCLIGRSLVAALHRDVEPFTSRIDEIVAISMTKDATRRDSRIVEVQASSRGRAVTVRPRALVLAAGAGNQALLDLAAAGRRASAAELRDVQQLRLGHMLVIKGPKGVLEPLTGIFPDLRGLFIVSRVVRQEGREDDVVWLVSDDRSPPLAFLEDWLDHDARTWLPDVVAAITRLAPFQFADEKKKTLQWGVYAAPKAEGRSSGGGLPDEERIEQLRVANLWVVWPTKLTLAPRASRTLVRQLRDALGSPTRTALSAEWDAVRRPPDIAPERWTRTPMLAWDDFRRCYSL